MVLRRFWGLFKVVLCIYDATRGEWTRPKNGKSKKKQEKHPRVEGHKRIFFFFASRGPIQNRFPHSTLELLTAQVTLFASSPSILITL